LKKLREEVHPFEGWKKFVLSCYVIREGSLFQRIPSDGSDSLPRERVCEMDRAQYDEAQKRLEEVTRILKNEKLGPEERERLEREGKELARVVMSPWLPFNWSYRMMMVAIGAIGFYGLAEGQYFLVLIWLLLPLFSPRIIGKFILAIAGIKDL
jgi:hypothetical protein